MYNTYNIHIGQHPMAELQLKLREGFVVLLFIIYTHLL